MFQDLKFAARSLSRTPGFSAIAVLTLALGIGVNTSVFSMINLLLFRPPPVERPGDLVWISSASSKPNGPQGNMTYPDVHDMRSLPVVAGVLAYGEVQANIAHSGHAERLNGHVVTSNYFELLGLRPHRGRFFGEDDDRDGNPVAVISFALWTGMFGARDDAIGAAVHINGSPFTICGVAPRGFAGPSIFSRSDVWMPIGASKSINHDVSAPLSRTSWWLRSIARLAPAVSDREATAAFQTRAASIASAFPDSHDGFTVRLTPLGGAPPGDRDQVKPLAGMLMAATMIVLVIACANVANLLLARNAAKGRDRAIRVALGASRVRLLRERLAESTVLASGAGAVGLLLSMWSTDLLLRFGGVPLEVDPTPDHRVLLFTLGISILTGLLFGVLPALRVASMAPNEAMKGIQASGDAPSRSRLPRLLVSGQLALSLVLLLTAGLFLKGIANARMMPLGLEPDGRVSMSLNLRMHGYTNERAIAFQRALLERARAIPGIDSATMAALVPLGGRVSISDVTLPNRPADPEARRERVSINHVWPEFFSTLGMPLVAGRPLDERDMGPRASAAVISEAMARRYWPDRSPLGERFSVSGVQGPFVEIVGVVRDTIIDELTERPWPAAYLPYHPNGDDFVLLAHARIPPGEALRLLELQVHALDAAVAVFQPMTLRQHVAERLDGERALGRLLSVVGLLALTLAAVGLYGVVAFTVSRRTREIGVRIALGAQPADVVRLFLLDASRLAVGGLAGGILPAIAVTALLASSLVGVRVADPTTMLAVMAILTAVVLIAAYLPARRATRIDPVSALRAE
jgi:predicted permease